MTLPNEKNSKWTDFGEGKRSGWAFPGCEIGESLEACRDRLKAQEEKQAKSTDTGQGMSGEGYEQKTTESNLFTLPGCLPGETPAECRKRMKVEQAGRKFTGKSAWDFTD